MEMTQYGYLCAGGETFDSVARTIWGDEKYASELMCANPEYCTQPVFLGGERLFVPAVSVPDEDDNAAAEPEKAPWKE